MNGSMNIAEQIVATARVHSWAAYTHLAPSATARPKAEGFTLAALRAPADVARAPQRFPDVTLRGRCLV
ncbi:hypothetical protein [Gordonia effusa]|uniref:hypothetical protein n=1 Tax=Gordonia effusa TaxID=263908 RepID=UPI0002E2230D|nr:hypothetical protein [Gordonia effusa]